MPHIGETDIFRTRPSFTPYFFIILGIAVLVAIITLIISPIPPIVTLGIVLIGVFAITVVFLAWLTTEYALTTEKVHIRRGIITRYHEDIEVTRVSSVELHQGILGRILNYGDIVIDGDSPNSRIIFRQIGSPVGRHGQIEHETLG
ncbi:PH domain-containing protein [Candidatus Berkelbacteria bacterium]|nr:PH domain-containing protein [Candidatus Berkelbacteria bacterium]